MNQDIINREKHYIQFRKLKEEHVQHLFTLKPFNFRKGVVDKEKIREQYKEIAEIFNRDVIFVKPLQQHTNKVEVVTENNMNDEFLQIDGLITNLKGVALVTSLADCQGILLYDKKKQVIGNIHAGWRGTLNRIIENAIKLMISTYNCQASDIEAYICPSILKCCFEVDEDVKKDFIEGFKDIDINKCIDKGLVKEGKQKYFIDTTLINKMVMMRLGLKESNIVISNICSKCNGDIIHSYRYDKDLSGRNIAVICL